MIKRPLTVQKRVPLGTSLKVVDPPHASRSVTFADADPKDARINVPERYLEHPITVGEKDYSLMSRIGEAKLSEEGVLLKKYLDQEGIIGDHISDFNDWMEVRLPKLLADIRIKVGSSIEYVRFTNIEITNPMAKLESKNLPLPPIVARNEGLSYMASVYVTIQTVSHEILLKDVDGKKISEKVEVFGGTPSNKFNIFDVPVMVKSNRCWLHSMTPPQLMAMKECPYDPGGYFIIKGTERILMLQEKSVTDKPIMLFDENSKPSSYQFRMTVSVKNSSEILSMRYNIRPAKITVVKNDSLKKKKKTFEVVKQSVRIMRKAPKKPGAMTTRNIAVPAILAYLDEGCDILLDYVAPFTTPEKFHRVAFKLQQSIIKARMIGDLNVYFSKKHIGTEFIQGNPFDITLMIKGKLVRDFANNIEFPGNAENFFKYFSGMRSTTEGNIGKLREKMSPDEFSEYVEQASALQKKLNILGFMMTKFGEFLAGYRSLDNRDSWANKRLSMPGQSLEINYRGMIQDLVKHAEDNISSYLADSAHRNLIPIDTIRLILKRKTITDDITKNFATGLWGVRNQFHKTNFVDILKRDSFLSVLSSLTRINTQTSRRTKQKALRNVQPSQVGFVCVTESPEGENCGIVKVKATGARITSDTTDAIVGLIIENILIGDFDKRQEVRKMFMHRFGGSDLEIGISRDTERFQDLLPEKRKAEYAKLNIDVDIEIPAINPANANTSIIMNGKFIGWTEGSKAVEYLTSIRRKLNIFPRDISISMYQDVLYIYTNGSRVTRPLLIFDTDGKLIFDKLKNDGTIGDDYKFNDLVVNGAVEFIDAQEQDQGAIKICTSLTDLKYNADSIVGLGESIDKIEVKIDTLKQAREKVAKLHDPDTPDLRSLIRIYGYYKFEPFIDAIEEGTKVPRKFCRYEGAQSATEKQKELRVGKETRLEKIQSTFLASQQIPNDEKFNRMLVEDRATYELLSIEAEELSIREQALLRDIENRITPDVVSAINEIRESLSRIIVDVTPVIDPTISFPEAIRKRKQLFNKMRYGYENPLECDDIDITTVDVHMIDIPSIDSHIQVEEYERLRLELKLEEIKNNSHYTHCELDPSATLGFAASTIPYPNRNQAPRNSLSCAMMKQALSLYHHFTRYRFDTTIKQLAFPSVPLVESQIRSIVGMDTLPASKTIMLAVNMYDGSNQEDAITVNRNFVDSGAFMTVIYKTYQAIGKSNQDTIDKIGFPDLSLISEHKRKKYHVLDTATGLPIPGRIIREGEYVIGKSTTYVSTGEVIDTSIPLHIGEGGMIDTVRKSFITNGNMVVKVKVRQVRSPIVGDKVASFSAQKSVIGRLLNPEDMPRTADGEIPDLIINSLALPSRMTVGKLIEMTVSNIALYTGKRIDSTAFNKHNMDDYRRELREYGFNDSGKVTLYSGISGEKIRTQIFTGPCSYQVLRHMVADKYQARSRGSLKPETRQPTGGRKSGGVDACGATRLGTMELTSFISHGASSMIRERYMEASDEFKTPYCNTCRDIAIIDIYNNKYICRICKRSDNLSILRIPYATRLLINVLSGAGIKIGFILKDIPQQI